MLRVIGVVLVLLAVGVAPARAQQPMVLVADGYLEAWEWHTGRVWTAPRAVGQAGALDRIGFEPATGELVVVIIGHPTRSGEEGRYATPGECLMRLSRPDLAGSHLVIDTPEAGASVLRFEGPRGVVAGRLRVSEGCDTTGAW